MSDKSSFVSGSTRESKGVLLNQIVAELLKTCDSILAVIIADWQGLSFASKLPQDVNEEEISATTLFTLEGAEGTRKELEKSLLGKKLSYLILVTERENKPAYMIIFPIEDLGYIACISHTREDMAVIIQNMKIAAKKAADILAVPQNEDHHLDTIEQLIAPKYDNLMKKLNALKNVKIPFLECVPASQMNTGLATQTETVPITQMNSDSATQVEPAHSSLPSYPQEPIPISEVPPIGGAPLPPELPMELIEVETEIEELEPEILPVTKKRFQVTFRDSKNIKYTVILSAQDQLDAEVRIRNRENFHEVEILEIKCLDE
ncbi:MAG: roadblock/LC7 domain-containing protein [Candidatus Helarchaeota archaeon]